MTKEDKLKILDSAEELAFSRLSKMTEEDMASEELAHLLQNMASIHFEKFRFEDTVEAPCSCGGTCSCHDAEAPTPKAELTPKPDELPKHPATEEKDTPAEEKSQPALTMVQVRAKLADIAAVSGVDLPGLLAQFGAAKLSEIDPSKYEALLAAAEKAAKEA